jgi:hypothetical protein
MPCLLLLLVPAAVLAQPSSKVLVATGHEVIASVISPGALACIGGTPTGLWPQFPPCSPETTRILFSYRNALFNYQQVSGSAASLVAGTNNVVTHCNVDANGYGHCWGHFVWTVPGAGGQWEGSWSGMFDVLMNISSYTLTGYGHGGKLEGLQLRSESVAPWPGEPTVFIVKISGN